MPESELSRHDANETLDLIHALLDCENSRDFQGRIRDLNTLLLFDHIRCAYGDKAEVLTKKMGAFHLLTPFPLAWEQRYHEKNYLVHDPVALTSFHKADLFHWAEARDMYSNEKSRLITDEATCFGLNEGWIFSLQGRKKSECSVVSLAGKSMEKTVRSRTILQHVLPHLGLAIQRVFQNERPNRPRLTAREREILSWISQGKSAWDISIILNISRRTVEFHTRNILSKLDALNSQQAVAIAMDFGLLI